MSDASSTALPRWQRLGSGTVIVLVPLLVLAVAITLVMRNGDALIASFGHNPPSPDEFTVKRVDFVPSQIKLTVTNPQREDLTIASVTVDDAIVPFRIEEGDATLDRLESETIVVDYHWLRDEPYVLGVTSSSGIQTVHEIPAAVERVEPSGEGVVAGGILGLLVGVLPVALGMAWLPAIRRADANWLVAFMALTAGLLTFIALESLVEAAELQRHLPEALASTGVLLLGVAMSFLVLSWVSSRHGNGHEQDAHSGSAAGASPLRLALLVAIGIGLHNMGEGLAIGSSFALGELSLGIFLVVGFMLHNLTEGIGIAAPASRGRLPLWRAVGLVLIAGAPAIVGIWIGRYVTDTLVGVLFFSLAAGAALHVAIEVMRYARTLQPGPLVTGWSSTGFVAGLAIMAATGVLTSG